LIRSSSVGRPVGIALLTVLVSACDRLPGTEAYAIRIAEDRVARLLLDPDSAVFTEVVAYGSQHERVCGVVNGRNRMGGYAEPVRFISSPSLTALGQNTSEDDPLEACLFEAATAFYCADVPGPAIATAGCY
jgi:hypothetical protein